MVGSQLTVANCGDSRWVLGRRRGPTTPLEAKDLSVDQNPDDPAERARVLQMGGWVGKEEDSSEARADHGSPYPAPCPSQPEAPFIPFRTRPPIPP